MKKLIAAATLIAMVVPTAVQTDETPTRGQEMLPDYIGEISMQTDGTLCIRLDPPVHPAHANRRVASDSEDYEYLIAQAEGILRGQTKKLLRAVGWARKNADGSLQIEMTGGGSDQISAQVFAGTIAKDSPQYKYYLAILGDMPEGKKRPILQKSLTRH